ncbi:MAG: hypothetical protein V4808_14810, partial [Pseudomonadota bacterium]
DEVAPPSVMTITVQKLPAAFKVDPVITLTFNEKGAVASCKTKTTSGSKGIDTVACRQVTGNVNMKPEAGVAAGPRDATVTFIQEAPKN